MVSPDLNIPQGLIELDSDFAKQIGFNSALFKESSYLWGDNDRIIISMIESRVPGKGAFRALLKACGYLGFKVAVPTPLPRMRTILEHYGFEETIEESDIFGAVDVWIKGIEPNGVD